MWHTGVVIQQNLLHFLISGKHTSINTHTSLWYDEALVMKTETASISDISLQKRAGFHFYINSI